MGSVSSGKASRAGTLDTLKAFREFREATRALYVELRLVPLEDRPEGWKNQPCVESGDPNRGGSPFWEGFNTR